MTLSNHSHSDHHSKIYEHTDLDFGGISFLGSGFLGFKPTEWVFYIFVFTSWITYARMGTSTVEDLLEISVI